MPKEHFKPECHVVIFTPRGQREIEVNYEALILSKSMLRETLFEPQDVREMLVLVPAKEKERPVLGQTSSSIEKLTRPRSRVASEGFMRANTERREVE